MLELTLYGKNCLEKQGIYLTKTGKRKEHSTNYNGNKRLKSLNFKDELTKVDDQVMQSLGGNIKEITQKYYTEPSGLVSKRSKKMAKNVMENYDKQSNLGYVKGDRLLFANLSSKIGSLCSHPEQRPPGEKVFRRLIRVMDKKQDRPGPVSDNCW